MRDVPILSPAKLAVYIVKRTMGEEWLMSHVFFANDNCVRLDRSARTAVNVEFVDALKSK